MATGKQSDADAGPDEPNASRQAQSEEQAREVDAPLTYEERQQVNQSRRLSAVAIYSIVRREGEAELHRPKSSLWWSGIAAGAAISSSLLAEALVYAQLPEGTLRPFAVALGYTVGFVIVILSRLQLFTENTITVILPLLAKPTRTKLWLTARLWLIVIVANLVGTFLTAAVTYYLGTASPDYLNAMLEVSREGTEARGLRALYLGIPAGFLIAAIVWILPSSKGFEIHSIMLVTFVIGLGGFTHVVVGASELSFLMLNGELHILDAANHLLPVLVGNVIGGSGLFALLAYGQVHEEI